MSLSWSPPSAIYRGDRGDFVSGKDSLSAAELQWGGGKRTRQGKTFPHIGKKKLFYLLYRKRVLLSFPLRGNKNPGGGKGVTGRYECNPFTLGG
jgi:hypothetical protein